ncbi:MAG: methionyl-tRNA formyltransferase [Candidatus Pacebacteria bacterium]|nr:methionyl-tRNA formyltransferase [Candidatus Paceibacterota bacterium]
MEHNKVKIIFIGTPEFGAIVLEELIKGGYPPVLVVTSPDKKVGRKQVVTPPPVKIVAEKNKIPVEQPEKIKDIITKIKNINPDLIIVAAFGQIFPKEILEIPKYGCLNVHPSLLPKYRGPSPTQFTILNGEKKSGVTIMLIDDKIDHGPIVSQKEMEIEEKETAQGLHDKLALLGAKLLSEIIPQWIKKEITAKNQDETRATFTKILKREDGKIDWRKPAEVLEREIRAYFSWPGNYAFWEDRGKTIKIKIIKSRVLKSPEKERYPIGQALIVPQNEIGVQCGKDFLVIEKLQMEGKNEMAAEDFLRGHPNFTGSILK